MMEPSKSDFFGVCACGKRHASTLEDYLIGRGALDRLGEIVARYAAKRVYLLADRNTEPLAGERIRSMLAAIDVVTTSYIFPDGQLEPDEHAVERAEANFPDGCDLVLTLGSGVLNDIGKLISSRHALPYVVVATAPSMDGYASATSSMVQRGLKVSVNTKCPNVIIGDVELLKTAPLYMAKAGLGDMLAKYVSICEWRISHLINGEYYCEKVAGYVRDALKKCIDHADGLLDREDESIIAVMEGLISCGMAMEYAGLSRPASGVEHYFSHVCDMRGLEFGTAVDLHGIQCAVSTLAAVRLYERLMQCTLDRQRALDAVAAFSPEAWNEELRGFLGKSAEAMIEAEQRDRKYDRAKHAERLDFILAHWEEIRAIAAEELPASCMLEALFDRLEMPKTLPQLGIDERDLPMILKASKDIRDKYVLSRLLWDLGLLDEFCRT